MSPTDTILRLIDFLLNLAGLLSWLSWRAVLFDPLARSRFSPAASLIGTLRKADPAGSRRWRFLIVLATLLVARGAAYSVIGPAVNWTPKLFLGTITLPFGGLAHHPAQAAFAARITESLFSSMFARMTLFSILSFLRMLAVFYFCLLLLSAVNASEPEAEPIQRLVRLHLGWLESWPRVLKLLIPFVLGFTFWLAIHPALVWFAIVPPTRDSTQLFEQAAMIGAMSYLAWKYLLIGILVLHLVNSYVYFGNHPFWNFVNASARRLLFPLSWLPLRLGKVDFSPVVAVALVFFLSYQVVNLPVEMLSVPSATHFPLLRLMPF